MPLVGLGDVLRDAFNDGYAVGAFNAINLEFVQGIIEGAEQERAPVIIQVSQAAIEYAGLANMATIVTAVAKGTRIPVVLHLDHARSVDLVREALQRGFTSVMLDASRLPIEDNIRLTLEAVEIAHANGIWAEGEIGVVPSAASRSWSGSAAQEETEPGDALRFAQETGVDALAIAVGSVHKMTVQSMSVDVERVKAIRDAVKLPLVLHGSSGVTDISLKQAVSAGITKVNIATSLSVAYLGGLSQFLRQNPSETDARSPLANARKALSAVVASRIRNVGSSGRAFQSFMNRM